MDLKYYNAAAEGKIEVFKDINDHQSLHLLLTPIKNTVLHIYITALNSKSKSTTPNVGSESTITPNAGSESTTNFVEEILKMCPLLLWKANAKDETPLHIAARFGHGDIVEVLINYCARTLRQDLEDGIELVKKMLRMRNKQGDTALHEAVRYSHDPNKVVELLIREDPDFSYSNNNANETPLYIAAERGFKSVVLNILDKCKSPIMHGGPFGRTALHAAVIRGARYEGARYEDARYEGMTQTILDKIEGISRKVDNNGWTPLHLAAYFDYSYLAELLLEKDREVTYMKDREGRTALHIAAHRGSIDAMDRIVSMCPDCCELVDNSGWNVLHFAMKAEYNRLEDMIKIIIKNSSLSNLLNEKNADGDTPLHFYFNTSASVKNFVSHPQVEEMVFNEENLEEMVFENEENLSEYEGTENLSALMNAQQPVITDEVEEKKNKDENEHEMKKDKRSQRLQKAAQTHLVVAALITTVTFAACITMPGGFAGGGEGSHPGSALLRRNAAFKAFVITDTISMVLSSSAVSIHLVLPFLSDWADYDDEKHHKVLLIWAFLLILGAMVAMVLAFVTGTYAVLGPSWDLAIANCIIGLTYFVILVLLIRKVVKIESKYFRG